MALEGSYLNVSKSTKVWQIGYTYKWKMYGKTLFELQM